MERRLKINHAEVRKIKEDHAESRRFIKEINLKLRRRQSQDEDALCSLHEMIIEGAA